MKSVQRSWTWASIACLAVAALAYLWYEYRFPSWREEVSLSDGRSITVGQRRDFVEGYGTRRSWLTFSLPEMNGEQTWSEWLYPTMIGVQSGKVYVVGRPRADKQFSMYSYPRYTYVAFEWRDGKFERIPFLSVPLTVREQENVRWCLPGGSDSKEGGLASISRGWCQWPPPPNATHYFPRTKKVDLAVRAEEAKFWARLSGNQPSSE